MKQILQIGIVLLAAQTAFASPSPSCQDIYGSQSRRVSETQSISFKERLMGLVTSESSSDEDLAAVVYVDTIMTSVQKTSSAFFRDEELMIPKGKTSAVARANDLNERLLADAARLRVLTKAGFNPKKVFLQLIGRANDQQIEELSQSLREGQYKAKDVAEAIQREQVKNLRLQALTAQHEADLDALSAEFQSAIADLERAIQQQLVFGEGKRQVEQILIPTLQSSLASLQALKRVAQVNELNLKNRVADLNRAASMNALLPTVSIPVLANQSVKKLDLAPASEAPAQVTLATKNQLGNVPNAPGPSTWSESSAAERVPENLRHLVSTESRNSFERYEEYSRKDREERLRIVKLNDGKGSSLYETAFLFEVALGELDDVIRAKAVAQIRSNLKAGDLKSKWPYFERYAALLLFSPADECRALAADVLGASELTYRYPHAYLLEAVLMYERKKPVVRSLRAALSQMSLRDANTYKRPGGYTMTLKQIPEAVQPLSTISIPNRSAYYSSYISNWRLQRVSPDVRIKEIRKLEGSGDIPVLYEVILCDPDPTVRKAAFKSIRRADRFSHLESKTDMSYRLEMLYSPYADVRRGALSLIHFVFWDIHLNHALSEQYPIETSIPTAIAMKKRMVARSIGM